MPKRPFIRKPKRRRHGTAFWDKEYQAAGHLALSLNPSEDLTKFTRWLKRRPDTLTLNENTNVLDLGCGNGRNLFWLTDTFGVNGQGFDSSSTAISEAKRQAGDHPLTYEVRTIAEPLPVPTESKELVLDMMSSHFLNNKERTSLLNEIYRVLVPGGWLFIKTFLLDDDLHSKRLLAESPGPEPGTYIHPVIGVPEHVYSEAELTDFLGTKFIVHKIYRSHKHRSKGKARKRRTISVYAEKDYH